MNHGFTHYWNRESWDSSRQDGGRLDWLASSLWHRAGVGPGDTLYPVTVVNGAMYVAGRMVVERIVPRAEAVRILGTDDIWDSPYVALAKKGTATTIRHDRRVSIKIVRQLRFDSGGPVRALVLHGDELDQQTLRNVRRLTPESKDLLDALSE